ncbi:MAG: UDP-N-acetylmuramate--L-alanine ligase [Microgenomates bacterium OLB23]|nr:MAG: UDP-N-acetylmuramate--L-alanine ligase [Microgenomates bacterium OLB23]
MNSKNIYMLGIKGVGMTSLALLYHRMGNTVSGSDVQHEFITDTVLQKYGIKVHDGFDASHIAEHFDEIVVSGAHAHTQNVEFNELLKQHISHKTHAEALGAVMNHFKLKISVCGTHGKTTSSSMLATIFAQSHLKGAHHIGVPTFSGLDGGAYSGDEYIIVEADEYANNPFTDKTPRFNFQHPDIIYCTNIDYDHPDIYASLAEVQNAFIAFMRNSISQGGKVVYCADDPGMSKVVSELAHDHVFSYGLSKSADLVVQDVVDDEKVTQFKAVFKGNDMGEYTLQVGGMHNVLNAAGALLTSQLADLQPEVARVGLAQFYGSARRFELKTQHNSTYVYDDYAHHPKEIAAVVSATRNKFPHHRIVVIFQPHTVSRTNAYAADFERALQLADKAYVMSVFYF